MSEFEIDSAPYPLVGTLEVDRVRLDHRRRAFSGKMRSSLPRDSGMVARSWSVRIGHLTPADAATLEALLATPGTVEISGDLIGATAVCHPLHVRRSGNGDGLYVVAVVLEESTLDEIPQGVAVSLSQTAADVEATWTNAGGTDEMSIQVEWEVDGSRHEISSRPAQSESATLEG